MPTHSVSLDRLLAAQPNHRLPLEASLYVASEISRLVAGEHELNRGVGPALQQVQVTGDGGVVLGAARHGLDVAGDVLSVGRLVYRLLTGKEPTSDVLAPSHFNPGVDEELDAVVLATLAPNPNRRPQSLRVLESALGAVFEELELEPNPGGLGKLAKALPIAAAAAPLPKPQVKAAAAPAPKPVMQAPQPAIMKPAMPKYRPPVRFTDEVEEEVLSEAMSQPTEVPLWIHLENAKAWVEPRRKLVGGITAGVILLLLFIAWPSSKKHRVEPESEPVAETVKAAPARAYQLVPDSLVNTVHASSSSKTTIKKTIVARRK